jgi:membrane dipeptidase
MAMSDTRNTQSNPLPSFRSLPGAFVLLLLAVLIPLTLPSAADAGAGPGAAKRAVPKIVPDAARVMAHVRFLASDELKGRKSGTPEYRKAAEYVADEMRKAGLRPGGDDGTWFQEVPLKNWTDFDGPVRLEIVSPVRRVYFAGRGRDFTPVSGTGSGAVRGGLVFAGHGVVSEKSGWDDYAALDVAGKIVLVLADLPESLAGEERSAWGLEKKVKTAAEKGAVGLIEMDLASGEPRAPGERRQRFSALRPGQCPEGFIVMGAGRDFLNDVFYLVGKSWRDLVSKTLRLKKPMTLDLGAVVEMEAHFVRGERTAPNVVGVLAGRDPKLKDQAIVVGGHLDHLGVGVDGWVYPGADDNAASVAAILEIARALTAGGFKPARTIVFCAWAGEEMGLHGSRHYTEHPAVPLDRTVLYMNIDMVGTGDSDLLVGGMTEFAELYAIAERGLDEETKKLLKSRPNYRGSDHTSFWGKGVPAVSLRSGEVRTGKLDDEHPEYHMPGDRPDAIDPAVVGLACQYHTDILQNLASTRENLLDPIHRTLFMHREASVVDLHCDTIARAMAGEDLSQDLPKGHIDIPKLKRGGVDLQVFACFAPPPANEAEKGRSANGVFAQIEAIHELVEKNPDDLNLVLTLQEAAAARNAGKTGVLIAIEGGYAIENDLVLLREFHRAGVRMMTLTHWTATDWADASGDPEPKHGGLTEFGESVVAEMNKLGMVIDVSHVHDETFRDVLRLSKMPVVASHSGCRALAAHHRNLSDEMLKVLAEKNGMVGINFWPGFLSEGYEAKQTEIFEKTAAEHGLPADRIAIWQAEPAVRDKFYADFRARWAAFKKTLPPVDVKTVVDHIDHVVKVTGDADHVGLGSDFDGLSETATGLENAGLLPNITKELVRRGYKRDDIRKILGGNFLRILGAVERVERGRTSENQVNSTT